MQRCRYCGTRFEYLHDSCPQCLRPLTVSSADEREGTASEFSEVDSRREGPFRTIARFANAAEAGFFAHALQSVEEVPATIRAEDNFDAVSGRWSTRFLLDVPEAIAESAAGSLQALIERSETEDIVDALSPAFDRRDYDPLTSTRYRFENDAAPVSGGGFRWGPIVLTLAAGSMAIVGIRALQPAANPRRGVPVGSQKELWEKLSRPGKPWTRKLNGNRRRELEFNADRTRATIREYDGDKRVGQEEFAVPARGK
ncbi:MAG: hypothetical protein ACE5KM_05565 [Planctomycetaceae bacterium]